MSAIKKELIIIDVTRGDCLSENRISGKSNTGTYFVSSLKDFDKFEEFFAADNKYELNLSNVSIYNDIFMKYFYCFKDEYIGKMEKYTKKVNYLLNNVQDASIKITTRINDSRVFMRFVDNQNAVVDAFRNLLYENISRICIEKKEGNSFLIYPVINETTLVKILSKEKQNDFFEVDDEEEFF